MSPLRVYHILNLQKIEENMYMHSQHTCNLSLWYFIQTLLPLMYVWTEPTNESFVDHDDVSPHSYLRELSLKKDFKRNELVIPLLFVWIFKLLMYVIRNVNSALWSAGIKSYSYIQGSVVDSCWNFYRVGQVNGNIFGSDESFLFWERKGEVSRLDLARESIVIQREKLELGERSTVNVVLSIIYKNRKVSVYYCFIQSRRNKQHHCLSSLLFCFNLHSFCT